MKTQGQRLLANTGAMYVKMIITGVVGVLSSRYILHALGTADFGVYAVVLGVTAFLGFINDAMVTGTQRYMAFSLGKEDIAAAKRVFNTCLIVHAAIAIAVILVVETLGVWFLEHKLRIPSGRMCAASWTLQFALIMSVANIISVPYQALMSAHEAFLWISIFGVCQSVLTLGIALMLFILQGDLLIWYSLLLTSVMVMSVIASVVYCRINYAESSVDLKGCWDKVLAKEVVSFSSWNLFGALAVVSRSQGLALLFNIFCGPVLNAAYGLANQVSGVVGQFSYTMLRAVSPQVVKSEGAGDRRRVVDLAMRSSRLAFLLDTLWVIPLCAEMPMILHLWLTRVPPHTTAFCRLVLVMFALDKLTIGFISAVQAVGKIALYQAVLGSILMLTLPIGYLLMRIGYAPETVLVGAIVMVVVVDFGRVLFARKLVGASAMSWVREVIMPCSLCAALGVATVLPSVLFLSSGLLRLSITLVIGFAGTAVAIWFIGVRTDERAQFSKGLLDVTRRFRGH